jgi:8-oxo-dGTP diphosphatase
VNDLLVPQPAAGERWIVGAVIHDGAGRIFMQRRSEARSLFPGAWDLVGGHLEPGESILGCLAREVREETGWDVERLVTDLGLLEWTGNDGLDRREVDYLVEVTGDLAQPQLEMELHHDPRWVTRAEAMDLLDGSHPSDDLLRVVVDRAFDALKSG